MITQTTTPKFLVDVFYKVFMCLQFLHAFSISSSNAIKIKVNHNNENKQKGVFAAYVLSVIHV